MLCFLMTDADCRQGLLQDTWRRGRPSFNRVNVDGDTKARNDTSAIGSGRSGLAWTVRRACRVSKHSGRGNARLAKWVVKTRGSNKLVEIRVSGAVSDSDARRIANHRASPLVKTALFWRGRQLGEDFGCGGRAGAPSIRKAWISSSARSDGVQGDRLRRRGLRPRLPLLAKTTSSASPSICIRPGGRAFTPATCPSTT